MLGKGYSVQSALAEMNMVAEGYYATESIYTLNKNHLVSMPILDFVYNVIYLQMNVKKEPITLTTKLN